MLGKEAENTPRKRGPASRLKQQIQIISLLPKSKQKLVSEMLDAVITQAQQAGTDRNRQLTGRFFERGLKVSHHRQPAHHKQLKR
ncbi:hypothetical protein ACMSZN_002433 [Cronobacter dublinensis]